VLRNVTLSPLATEPLLLVGPSRARLDPKKPVGIEALAGLPIVTYRQPNYLRLLAETALRKRKLAFNVAIELETLPLMIELIERGAGYGILPPSALARHGGRVATAPLRGLSVTWTLAVNRARAQQPAVRALAEMIRAQADTLIKDGAWKAWRRAATA